MYDKVLGPLDPWRTLRFSTLDGLDAGGVVLLIQIRLLWTRFEGSF